MKVRAGPMPSISPRSIGCNERALRAVVKEELDPFVGSQLPIRTIRYAFAAEGVVSPDRD
jgi:hypothetical protein